MKNKINTFGFAVHFLFEKRSKSYYRYDAVSTAEEKCAAGQKQLQRIQLSCMTGSCVV